MQKQKYKKCYIAFMDMLGFKNLIKEKSCDYISKIFDMVHSYSVNVGTYDSEGKHIPEVQQNIIINTKIISDSICLYVSAEDPNNLMLLLFTCSLIQLEFLHYDTPIFVRGGIVCDYIYAKGDVIFGPGLTKAYLMEETNAKFPRIIMTNDITLPLRTPESKNGETTVETLIFRDFDGFYTVDYFTLLEAGNKHPELKDKLMNYANEILNTTIDSSLREKYLYFVNNMVLVSQRRNIIFAPKNNK